MRKTALLIVATSLAVGFQVFGEIQSYRDTELRYSLTLPERWQQIPNDVIQATTNQTAQAAKMPAQEFAAGFQKRSGAWFTYPYVLIQNHPVNSATFGQLSSLMKDLGSDEDELLPNGQAFVSEVGIGEPVTDSARGIVMVPLKMNVANVGPVRGLMALKPGRLGIAQLSFYAPEGEFEDYAVDLNVFLDSLQFDKGYEYSRARAVARGLGVGRILEKGLVGAILGLLAGLIAWAVWRGRDPAQPNG